MQSLACDPEDTDRTLSDSTPVENGRVGQPGRFFGSYGGARPARGPMLSPSARRYFSLFTIQNPLGVSTGSE